MWLYFAVHVLKQVLASNSWTLKNADCEIIVSISRWWVIQKHSCLSNLFSSMNFQGRGLYHPTSIHGWWAKKLTKHSFQSNHAKAWDLKTVRTMDYATAVSKWMWRDCKGANPILSDLQAIKCGLCFMTTTSTTIIFWRWGKKLNEEIKWELCW